MRDRNGSIRATRSTPELRRGQLLLAALLLCLILLVIFAERWVAADGAVVREAQGRAPRHQSLSQSAKVGLSPAYLEMPVGAVVTAHVLISDVVDLQGFHLIVDFDSAVVQVLDADGSWHGTNVQLGDFLAAESVPLNTVSNVTGTISVAVSQVLQPARSGSGCLISIVFEAIGPGDPLFDFGVVALSDPEGLLIARDLLSHHYLVLAPSPTPGPSATPTATPGPTSTPTSTPYFFLEPSHLRMEAGESKEMVIRTSYVHRLTGVVVYLTWNPSLLRVVDQDLDLPGVQVSEGNLFAGYPTFQPPPGNDANNTTGELFYALGLRSGSALSGEWTVATIRFEALHGGLSDVDFGPGTKMANREVGDIPTGWIDGQIQVGDMTPTTTPTSSATLTPTATETATQQPTVPLPTDTPTPVATVPEPTQTPTPTLVDRLAIPMLMKNCTSS